VLRAAGGRGPGRSPKKKDGSIPKAPSGERRIATNDAEAAKKNKKEKKKKKNKKKKNRPVLIPYPLLFQSRSIYRLLLKSASGMGIICSKRESYREIGPLNWQMGLDTQSQGANAGTNSPETAEQEQKMTTPSCGGKGERNTKMGGIYQGT